MVSLLAASPEGNPEVAWLVPGWSPYILEREESLGETLVSTGQHQESPGSWVFG